MTREANIATQQAAAKQINAGHIDAAIDTMFAEDAVDHDPAPGQGPGREGFRAFWHSLTKAFPDAKLAPATMVADDDQICIVYTLTGTHQGDFQGVAPTGRRIEVRGIQIGRFRDGKIVERWGSSDELGIMQQLGTTPGNGGKHSLADKVKDAFRS